MKKTVNLTKEGKLALEQELAELIAERPAVTERIATARAFGDLSENEEYSSARAEQKRAETRIQEIQEILKNAKTIRATSKDKVVIGTTVTIELAGKTHDYIIVGPVEADPLNGKISDASPLGRAIMGLKNNETFTMPNGNQGKIISIS